MTIRSTLTEHVAVVEMAGSMAAIDLSRLHGHLIDLLSARQKAIVLDFRAVEHVSYQDASYLAREFELVRSHNGHMKVAGLSPYVRNILVFAGLSDFLDANTPGFGMLEPARTPQAS
ncbi:MAG: STAS domain-containing protein [Candidatus Eisenbacteria sp.]|nr:STAS domain-containing protein [Candidatus Eisenbacteria bacterium]